MKKAVFLFFWLFCDLVFGQKKPFKPEILNLPTKNALNFYVIGDWGRYGGFEQKLVADQMEAYSVQFDPKFIISTGDNFYDNGVASTQDPHWYLSFETIYAKGGLTCPWYPVLGNHDYHGNPQAQIDYTKISRRWVLPSRYHTFVQKVAEGVSARFVFIDTSPFIEKYYKEPDKYSDLTKQDTARQWAWLDSVLSHSKERWKIVVGHHPVYSSSPKHGDQPELQKRLKPMLEKYGVQFYFCGHDHDLQHNQPTGSKVAYILSGAGSEIRPSARYEHTRFVVSAGGFVAVSLQAAIGEIYFITSDGKVPYRFKVPLPAAGN